MIFFLALLINILIHEASHLLAAKAVKCKVEIFSVGFGKPLWKKIYKGTIYQVCPILFGGYCKLANEMKYSRSKYAFTNLRYRDKCLISIAGVLSNFILGNITIALGIYFSNMKIYYFGIISIMLAITNIIPFPALDGSYLFLVWLEKFYGKKKGYALMEKICKIGFVILMILNVLCVPLIVVLYLKGLIL